MNASWYGKIDVACILVKAGADIDKTAQFTSLGYAAIGGHVLMARELLLWGADPTRMGSHQETAHAAAVRQGHDGVVRLLDSWGNIQAMWVVRSAEQLRRLSVQSALRLLPKELCREVGSMLVCL
jgi:hypothetical protein